MKNQYKVVLENLVKKLQEMEPHLNSVCGISAVHGFPYAGPTWEKELQDAKAVIEKGNEPPVVLCSGLSGRIQDVDLFDTPVKDELDP